MNTNVNATMLKFGWPDTQIADLDEWAVLLRPEQPVLGALVLVCKQPVTAFGDVDAAGFAEFGQAIKAIERMLQHAIDYEKINYLMLMMKDPDVHFHVLPRYKGSRERNGLEIIDAGWPGPPNLGEAVSLTSQQQSQMTHYLREHWSI